jgi:hypothetical protein
MFPSLLKGEERKFDELIKRARQQAEKQQARSLANFDEIARLEEQEKADRPKRKQKKPPRSPRSEAVG